MMNLGHQLFTGNASKYLKLRELVFAELYSFCDVEKLLIQSLQHWLILSCFSVIYITGPIRLFVYYWRLDHTKIKISVNNNL